MLDRASAVITLGGVLTLADLPRLLSAIAADNPACDWDGPPFELADLLPNMPLTLVKHAAAFGEFAMIEECCRKFGLAYSRWHDGAPSMPPTRQVFTAGDEPESFAVTTDNVLMLSMETIRRLGTLAAIDTYAARADAMVPPLRVIDAAGAPVDLLALIESDNFRSAA